jgi:hypothetical protein
LLQRQKFARLSKSLGLGELLIRRAYTVNDPKLEACITELAEAQYEKDKWVRIGGEVFTYYDKAPYTQSGASIEGAIEYLPDHQLFKCHECGLWTKNLAAHTYHRHNLPAKEYKKKHKLNVTTCLVSEQRRLSLMSAMLRQDPVRQRKQLDEARAKVKPRFGRYKRTEAFNRAKCCPEQCLESLRKIQEITGRQPSIAALLAHNVSLSALKYHFGSLTKACRAAGLTSHHLGHKGYTDEQLLEHIRRFYALHKRAPGGSDAVKRLLPSTGAYSNHFGSFLNAKKLALGKNFEEAERRLRRYAMCIMVESREANWTNK